MRFLALRALVAILKPPAWPAAFQLSPVFAEMKVARSGHAVQTRARIGWFTRYGLRLRLRPHPRPSAPAEGSPVTAVAMKSSHKPTLIALVLAFVSALAFTGCNTMSGVGKDVERAGEKIQSNAK
jgi:entericidin B